MKKIEKKFYYRKKTIELRDLVISFIELKNGSKTLEEKVQKEN